MVTIASIIRSTLPKLDQYRQDLQESLQNAANLSKRAFLHEVEAPMIGVRGPPGTGKTKIVEALINDSDVVNYLVTNNIRFIYIAPTNELVKNAFERALVPILQRNKGNPKEIINALKVVRMYGSTLPTPYSGEDIRQLASELGVDTDTLKEVLRKIVHGGVDDAIYVFSTEYQRASARSKSSHKFAMFVDEASRSPFYLPFNPVSDSELRELARGGRGGVIHALTVVGDDRQTIAVGPEYQGFGKSLLVLPKVEEVLNALRLEKLFTTLQTTFRLPSPTEEPIGKGFYGDVGGLRAYEEARVRIRRLMGDISERLDRCRNLRGDVLWNHVVKTVEEALGDPERPKPVIIANLSKSIPPGEQSEPCRIKLGVYYALLFSCLGNGKIGISVIAPYKELVDYARYYYRRLATESGRVRFLTVQSMLGGEDDVVISLLGKEWDSPEEPTIYFREPENLNVQFSRHRLVLVVVGNAIRLRNSAAKEARSMGLRGYSASDIKRIRLTFDVMFSLANIEVKQKEVASRLPTWSTGRGTVFHKMPCDL